MFLQKPLSLWNKLHEDMQEVSSGGMLSPKIVLSSIILHSILFFSLLSQAQMINEIS